MGNKQDKEAQEVSILISSNDMVTLLQVAELSPECLEEVKTTFSKFDEDDSKVIDKQEAIKHFNKGFAKL